MLRVVADDKTRAELGSGRDDLVREGARRMLAAALEAEVDAYVASYVYNGTRKVMAGARPADPDS